MRPFEGIVVDCVMSTKSSHSLVHGLDNVTLLLLYPQVGVCTLLKLGWPCDLLSQWNVVEVMRKLQSLDPRRPWGSCLCAFGGLSGTFPWLTPLVSVVL